MGAATWEPLGPKAPGVQWRGWGTARRFRCVECRAEVRLDVRDLKHAPKCKHARRAA